MLARVIVAALLSVPVASAGLICFRIWSAPLQEVSTCPRPHHALRCALGVNTVRRRRSALEGARSPPLV